MKTTLVLIGSLLLGACGDSDSTICDEASRHIATCLGSAPTGTSACQGRDADQAAELLALDCQSLGAYLSTGGKADGYNYSYYYSPEGGVSCDGANGTTSCEDYCKQVKVEFTVFGFELEACVTSSCDPSFVEGLGRCQCKYRPCLFGGSPLDDEGDVDEPNSDEPPAGEPGGDEPPTDEPFEP